MHTAHPGTDLSACHWGSVLQRDSWKAVPPQKRISGMFDPSDAICIPQHHRPNCAFIAPKLNRAVLTELLQVL